MRAVVTGGAGFIGSNLADRLLMEGHEVVVIDDLESGLKENVPAGASFAKKDITSDSLLPEFRGADAIFHFAADPAVRSSAKDPARSFSCNVGGTFRVLEACRKAGVKRFVFASTSTVYGDAAAIPTPEGCPCVPISNYAASKLACEAYASSYSHSYGIKSTVLRYANIFGNRSTHGVMFDFFQKLKKDRKRLEILGDGRQEKSYLHVSDCVSATMAAFNGQKAVYEIYNAGSAEKRAVADIARLVCQSLGVSPKLAYAGGERGWTGDVRVMLLDISKLRGLGWSAQTGFEQGVKSYMEWLKGRYGW